jgi:hypothetical protein
MVSQAYRDKGVEREKIVKVQYGNKKGDLTSRRSTKIFQKEKHERDGEGDSNRQGNQTKT